MNNKERQKLILDYYPLVRQIAFRMAKRFPSHIEVDDLIHIELGDGNAVEISSYGRKTKKRRLRTCSTGPTA